MVPLPGSAERSTGLSFVLFLLFALLGLGCDSTAPEAGPAAETPAVPVSEGAGDDPAGVEEEVAVIVTNRGTMVFRFFPDAAPKTVAHVKALIHEQFFDGKELYRVVAGHVIQGGAGFDSEGGPTVVGEFGAYPHVVGAVGLARDEDPDSGGTEIYICLDRRAHLDGRYAIFGLLVEGFDVLEAIGQVEVEEQWEGEVAFHRPIEPVVIESLRLERRELAPVEPPSLEPSTESATTPASS